VRGGLLVRGEIADRVKPWTVELLLPAGRRLPEGVEVGVCGECSNVSVYAALHAAGCPRLAFLLTDLDPRDPLDEELASWKIWLVRAVKRAERAANPFEVWARWSRGEIDATTARELLNRRVVELREWYEGFLVPTDHLHKLDSGELEEVRERALKGDVYAAVRLSVHAELERLARMAEAGFPDAPRIFDRFVDALGELGVSLRLASVEEKLPRERLRELEERGVGRWTDSGRFEVVACRADQVPVELKREVEVFVIPILRKLARLLIPIHLYRLEGFLLASVG
jgi:hypothetical protein